MGRLPPDLEEKRLRLLGAARRGAFDSYMRRGRVPDGYERIARAVDEAKNLGDRVSVATPGAMLPKGRPTNYYTWRTAGDQKVRNAHAALNGRVFSWSKPPEHGHPGHEPNCRCWPEPYYGDPAVPDALLTMVPGRRLSTEPAALWASIDTLTRPDGSLAASTVVLKDGTSIHSTFTGASVGHSVTLTDGGIVRLERDGEARKQLVHPPEGEPVQVAQVSRLLFAPPPPPSPRSRPVDQALAAALLLALPGIAAQVLVNVLRQEPASLGAGPTDAPVLVYRVWQSEAGAKPVLVTETLTKEQVTQWCPHAAEVQSFIDLAAQEWAPLVPTMHPAVLGTNIHYTAKGLLEVAKAVNPALANLLAEVSLDLEPVTDPTVVGVTYGKEGSTRLDVMELVSPEMGCVYDYKTGSSGLTTKRVLKIIEAWNNRFPGVPVVIIEMRQGLPVWSQ